MRDPIDQLFALFKKSSGVVIDTRQIIGGEIFFALKGEHSNGNAFAKSAIEKGALCAVVDDASFADEEKCFLVENSLTTLQQLAKKYRSHFSFPVFALTGTNGKTTTKELLRDVLSKKFRVHATKGNLNNHIGVPLTILSVPEDCNFAIIEMGANHLHEIASYCTIADPDYGLITNIGKAHLEGFGSEEGVLKAKSELFEYVMQKNGTLFYCSEQKKLVAAFNHYEKVISYGYDYTGFLNGKLIPGSTFATVEIDNKITIHSHLSGTYNADNILAAACTGKYFGVSYEQIADAIGNYIPENNRSEFREINGNYFIMDAYNANPSSMKAALANLTQIQSPNKIAILGDMLELGKYAAEEHTQILETAVSSGLKMIITIGPEFGKIKNNSVLHFENADDARSWWDQQHIQGATVLLKGSRGMRLEKMVS